jgi:signal transduction histidine kinase
LLHRWRVRQLDRRRQRLLDESLAERERIARQLHDTLLQGTQALILNVHRARTRCRPGEPAHDLLTDILLRADGVVAEARGKIGDFLADEPSSGELARVLARLGEEQALGVPVRFTAVVEGSMRPMAPSAFRAARLIGSEAMLNSFRHAQAHAIELRLTFSARRLRLTISDDGNGMQAKDRALGTVPCDWTLSDVRERAQAIGASIDIRFRPGRGTRVELSIPASTAYRERGIGWSWRSRRGSDGERPE